MPSTFVSPSSPPETARTLPSRPRSSGDAFAGAGSLVYPGVRRWRNAGTQRAGRLVPPRAGLARAAAIATGSALGDTPAIPFHVALVPQVLREQPATFADGGARCLTIMIVFVAVACAYVLLSTRVRPRLADECGRGRSTAAVLMAAAGLVVVAP